MKVVQINSVCGVGSTGRIAVDISKKLNDEGIENYIFYGIGESNYKNGIKFGGTFNIRLHQLGTRLLGKHGFYSKNATRKLIKRLKQIDPDIIHLHNIHGHYINVEILFKYLSSCKKKIIWTLHDCWSFTGHCSHFDFVGCDKWKTECNHCPQLKEYPRSLIFDRSRESFHDKRKLFTNVRDMTIITPSKWLSGLVSQSFLKDFDIKVINNGIDLQSFKPLSSNVRDKFNLGNKFVILGVASSWGIRKGFQYFINLSKRINDDEIIMMVGISEEQRSILPNNIIGITRTDSVKELAEIYSTADVFLNPTLEDTFPTTNLEALACGTPVITFDTGGSLESVDDKTGIVVEKGNLESLFESIETIKYRGKTFYSENCIKKSRLCFDKNSRFLQYVNLYKKNIEGKMSEIDGN